MWWHQEMGHWEVFKPWGWSLHQLDSGFYIKVAPGSFLPSSTMWGHSKKALVMSQKKRLLRVYDDADILILDFPASRTVRLWSINFCYKLPNGNPLQYSCPENPMDREAWRTIVHRFIKSQARLKQLSTHISYPVCVLQPPTQSQW